MKNQKTPSNTAWKQHFTKSNKPHHSTTHSENFWYNIWAEETKKMFENFSNELAQRYNLALTHPRYTVAHGWKFSYSLKNIVLVKNVHIFDDCFAVDGIIIRDNADCQKALLYVDSLYTDDFREKYNEKIATRNKKQVERAKRLAQRRKDELNQVLENVDSAKLNKFKWSPRVSRENIRKLYTQNSNLIYNEELVDEVGYTLYARCLQGRDENLLYWNKKLLCHNCKKIHVAPKNGFIACSCGYAYIFREYRKSFQKDRMPSGSATPFFNEFIRKWEKAKTYHEKMFAIDYVIHECHLNMISCVNRRFAGCDLIQGNKKEVSALILELAYSG